MTSIGIYAAAQIFYRANTTLLWSEPGYAETRLATTQAAEQLYGDGAEKDAVVEPGVR